MADNVYLPKLAQIIDIKDEISGARAIKTFRVKMLKEEDRFDYRCGQCAMLSVFGKERR